jgi:hypothetical protein
MAGTYMGPSDVIDRQKARELDRARLSKAFITTHS